MLKELFALCLLILVFQRNHVALVESCTLQAKCRMYHKDVLNLPGVLHAALRLRGKYAGPDSEEEIIGEGTGKVGKGVVLQKGLMEKLQEVNPHYL